MKQFFLACFLSGVAQLASAAGGSSMGTPMPQQAPKSPLELAVDNYNRGLAYRDKALEFEAKAAEQSDPKQNARLLKKSGKQFNNAAKRFRTAIKHNERLFQAHGSLGFALRKLGEYDAALESYNAALALNPRYAYAIEYRGETYLALGRLEETRQAYVQLVDLDQRQADLLLSAVKQWLASPPDGIAAGEIETMKNWAAERLALSRFVGESESGSWDSD